jgi:subtilase family serine protease
MRKFSQRFFSLLVALFLLTACGFINGNGNTGDATKASAKTSRPTHTATSSISKLTAEDVCPANLKNDVGCLTPHALREAYGVQPLIDKGFTGKGQTVVDIVSFGSPTLQQDMNVFDQQFGLPPVNMQVISPLTDPEYDPNGDKAGWAVETTLDVQIIHSLAPDAKIVVLTSPVAETEGTIGLPQFRALEQYAIDHKLGNIVSHSWGASELTLQDEGGQHELELWNTLLQQGTTQDGITYFSASGDNGATDFTDLAGKKLSHVATTSFSADSPWVTTVGGTNLRRNGAAFAERAWTGSGGGFSRFYKEPSYQQNLPTTTQQQLNNRRGVPDVSAAADPNTALAVYSQGAWQPVGGTSASTPIWAGMMAIADQMAGRPLGFINPALYKLASNPSTYAQDFRDVTVGNNTNVIAGVQGYAAGTGWDAVTGLGTPNAEKLLPDLIAAVN